MLAHAAVTALTAPAIGPDWVDPELLLVRFGTTFIWVSVVIVFAECGLLFPVLPGDALLFALGIFVADTRVDVSLPLALVALTAAAFLGNVSGYEIGRGIGPAIYRRDGRLVKRAHIDTTRAFLEQHGSRALVAARYVLVVRTFISVVAGVSRVDRRYFLTWSAVSAVIWVWSLVLLGYFLGQIAWVGDNFGTAVIAFSVVTAVPPLWEGARQRRTRRAPTATTAPTAPTPTVIDPTEPEPG